MVRSRYQAFFIHLGISLAIFIGALWVLFNFWYPGFLFAADGGWDGVEILIAVDLVLGPLLTLIVYKPDKPHLKLDLTIIGLIQSLCLAAGLWVIYNQRPILIVYVDGQFYSMSSRPFKEANVSLPDLEKFPGAEPKWVSVDIPEDVFEQSDLRKQVLASRVPLRLLSSHYRAFKPDAAFFKESFDLTELQDRDRESRQLPQWLAQYGGKLEDYAFYPFGARYKYVFFGFRRSDGQFMGLLDTPREEPPEPD